MIRRLLFFAAAVFAAAGLSIAIEQSPSIANGGPTVSSLSPTSGPKTGGTDVTITGTGLTGTTAVTVGGQPGTNITVDSDTAVRFTTPSGSVGAQDVVVTSGSSLTLAGGFTYAAVAPDAPTALTGIARDQAVDLSWTAPADNGGSAILEYRIQISTDGGASFPTSIDTGSTATTRSVGSLSNGTDYVFNIAAINAVNTGAYSGNSSALTPQDAPQISGVNPPSGTDLGGTSVVISGTNFTGTSAVSIAGTAAASFSVDSATQITAVTDSGTAGVGNVTVTTPSGTATSSNAFTYLAIPTITNVNPFYGPLAGGSSVVITGTNFTGATGVTFAGVAAASLNVDSATQITAVSPAGSAGDVDITVTTPDGSATETNGFAYFSPPSISSLSVESGPTTGGTSVVITGANFTGITAVTFGAINATNYTVDSPTQITATTPTSSGGAAGAVDVKIVNPGGSATRSSGFTYVLAGDPIEIVLRDKGTSQVQFHICHNLPNPTNLNLGMQIEFRIREGSTAVAPTNSDWLQSTGPDLPYQPSNTYNETHTPPADLGVSSSNIVMRYRPNQNPNVTAISVPSCGQHMGGVFPWFSNQTGSTGGTWEDGSGNPLVNGPALTPGSTYILEATLLTTTRSGTITHTTYRDSLVTTMGGGCPVGAPAESLPAFPQMWAGLDTNNRVVAVADVYAQNPWASYPSVVSTAYTYPTWPGKTFAQVGYYFDPRTNDFGPEAILGDVIQGSTVVTQADMAACEAAGYTITMTVDPDSSSVCSISNGSVVGSDEGACKVNVTATGPAPATASGLIPRTSASLTRSATFVVRPSTGGGGTSGGNPGGGSSSSSSTPTSGTAGGGMNEITAVIPGASGSPGSAIALAGWGLETTRAVYFGDYAAPTFSVVTGGQVDVVVPDIPAGVYPIHAVLAPEVGRATYWSGFTVQGSPSSLANQTQLGNSVLSTDQTTLGAAALIANPATARTMGRGVTILNALTAQATQPKTVKRNLARKVKRGPRPTSRVGAPTQLTVSGLPDEKRVRVQIRIGKKYRTIGFGATSPTGQLTLPAMQFNKAGNYRIRVSTKGKRYFMTVRVRG